MSQPELKRIPLSSIRENPSALRAVNRQHPDYVQFADSVKTKGVLNAILVRQLADDGSGTTLYGIIEGLHRYTASLDAGHPDIPAQIMSMDDAEVEEAQIVGNLHRIPTKNYQYSEHLNRLLARNPTQTASALAAKLNVLPQWLNDRLGLANLTPEIGKMLDSGLINVTNGVALSKLPAEEQVNFLERAQTESPQVFVPAVAARKSELDKAKRAGRSPSTEFIPVPRLQTLKTFKEELDKPTIGPILCREFNLTSAEDGFSMGVKWATHMDPKSIEIDKQKEEERKSKAKEASAKAAAERAKKKAEAAAEAAAKVQELTAVV